MFSINDISLKFWKKEIKKKKYCSFELGPTFTFKPLKFFEGLLSGVFSGIWLRFIEGILREFDDKLGDKFTFGD